MNFPDFSKVRAPQAKILKNQDLFKSAIHRQIFFKFPDFCRFFRTLPFFQDFQFIFCFLRFFPDFLRMWQPCDSLTRVRSFVFVYHTLKTDPSSHYAWRRCSTTPAPESVLSVLACCQTANKTKGNSNHVHPIVVIRSKKQCVQGCNVSYFIQFFSINSLQWRYERAGLWINIYS